MIDRESLGWIGERLASALGDARILRSRLKRPWDALDGERRDAAAFRIRRMHGTFLEILSEGPEAKGLDARWIRDVQEYLGPAMDDANLPAAIWDAMAGAEKAIAEIAELAAADPDLAEAIARASDALENGESRRIRAFMRRLS